MNSDTRNIQTASAPRVNGEPIKACLVSSVGSNVWAFFRGQLDFLQQHGFTFTVVTSDATREGLGLPDNVPYHSVCLRAAITPWTDLRSIYQLFKLFRRNRFDLVQYTTFKASVLGSIAAFLARVPIRLYLLWGIYFMGSSGPKRIIFKIADKLACRLSSHVTFDGHMLRDFAIAQGLCSAKHSSVVGEGGDNGIDMAAYAPGAWTDEGRRLRAANNVPADALIVGCVARLVGDKGINELVEAFAQIAEKRENVHLWLIGAREDKNIPRPETLDLIDNHPRIHTFDFQNVIQPYFAAIDVFALPTYREGFSAVNLEAAAMALPVVTTDAVGAGDSIRHEATGLAVPVRDAKALRNALVTLLDDPELRQEYGKAGRAWVKSKFEQGVFWNRVLEHRLALLERYGPFERNPEGQICRRRARKSS